MTASETCEPTNARSQVASTVASVVSFHCIICFDDFNTTDRPPMVLPCGHTYVCLPCTKRLKRCMECRESLFLSLPSEGSNASSNNSNNHQLYRGGLSLSASGSHSPRVRRYAAPATPAAPQQVALPIPKNVVLLAMMEAAELQKCRPSSEDESSKGDENDRSIQRRDDGARDSEAPEEDSQAFEMDKVIRGVATLSGSCGTYVVREKEGLEVVVQNPLDKSGAKADDKNDTRVVLQEANSSSNKNTISDATNRGVQTTVSPRARKRFLEGKIASVLQRKGHPSSDSLSTLPQKNLQDRSPSPPEEREDSACNEAKDPAADESLDLADVSCMPQEQPVERKLACGQKLQVVAFAGNVATLARNQGYVVASSSQLVKVGEPIEKSCFLEGLLDSVVEQSNGLRKSLRENSELEDALATRIVKVQKKAPSYPVISELSQSPPSPTLEPTMPSLREETSPSNESDTPMLRPAPTPSTSLQPSLQSPPDHAVIHGVGDACYTPTRPSPGDNHSIVQATSAPPMPGSPVSIDNADLDGSRSADSQEQVALTLGCGTNLLPGVEFFDHNEHPHEQHRQPPSTVVVRAEEHIRPRASTMSPGNPASHSNPAAHDHAVLQSGSSSFDAIDFRTGLSGHYGLTTAFKKSFKQHHSPTLSNRVRHMMGEHGGVGFGKRSRQIAPHKTVKQVSPSS